VIARSAVKVSAHHQGSKRYNGNGRFSEGMTEDGADVTLYDISSSI